MSLSIAVLLSGSGSNLQAIIERIEQKTLNTSIALVISNNPRAYGLQRARQHGLSTLVMPHNDYPSREEYDRNVVAAIKDAGAQVVVLAGFMRLLSAEFVRAFPMRTLNIHPALLPGFPGLHAQKQAFDYGVSISGATVHFVDEQLDHGPIVIQAAVPARPEDDEDLLAKRILGLEHRIYPQAIEWLCQKRISLSGRRVVVSKAQKEPADLEDVQPCLVNPALEKGF